MLEAGTQVDRPIPAADREPESSGDGMRRFERRAMGSPLRLSVAGVPAATALIAWGAVSDEFERAEQAMSRFRDTSDLTRLNRSAGDDTLISVDRRLRRSLAAAWRAQRVTGGRFDARVLADLERLGYHGVAVDAPTAGRSHDRWLGVEGRASAVSVDAPVDLGGIGKGLTLRWAWKRLWARLSSFEGAGALLEAGGDIVAGGPALDGNEWLIGIDDPLEGSSASAAPWANDPVGSKNVAVVTVGDGAICTSSVAVHSWKDPSGRRVHHLVDPSTGESGGEGLLSVTVAAADPAWAEVWSKTLFLAGARGIADAARGRGLTAWWVNEAGDLSMTPAARPRTVWTRELLPADRLRIDS
jgi:thiamine biosynthesis lipoprotein